MKKFTSVKDIGAPSGYIQEAIKIKKVPFTPEKGRGKTLGLLFFNPSLRTRMSTQKAAKNLGMDVMVLDINEQGWKLELEPGAVMDGSTQEHIQEAAAVMGLYCDVVGIRTFPALKNAAEDYQEKVLNKFIQHCSSPVISLESATRHPLQSLADLMTIEENKKVTRPKIVLTWAPHPKALPQAVANSFSEWVLEAGYDLTIACPEGFELSEQFTQGATISHHQPTALADADFIYVKNWSSFKNYGQTKEGLDHWMLDAAKLEGCPDAKVMHCLPVRRNVVLSDGVLDGPNSLVLQQAENRIYAAQAVLNNMI